MKYVLSKIRAKLTNILIFDVETSSFVDKIKLIIPKKTPINRAVNPICPAQNTTPKKLT